MATSPINQKATLRRRMEESGAEGDEAAEAAEKAKTAAAPAPAASEPVRFTRERSAAERSKGLAEALKKRGY